MVKATQLTLTTATVAALAFALMLAFATPAAAFWGGNGDDGDRTTVRNTNDANVSNEVEVKANTGYNVADGGEGNDGGDADAEGGDATGGNGGNGGDGGLIVTGDATAIGTIRNDVNSNRTVVEGCGCPEDDEEPQSPHFMWWGNGDDGDEITVTNRNRGDVHNAMSVKANTGKNVADGNGAGEGGDAATEDDEERPRHLYKWWWFMQNHDNDEDDGDATGGNGGHGGNGGEIGTGEAYADGLVTNVVNRNVTRVTR